MAYVSTRISGFYYQLSLVIFTSKHRKTKMALVNNLDDMNKEFTDFMHRLTEINQIVKEMSSSDKTLQEMGTVADDKILTPQVMVEHLEEGEMMMNVISDRTLLNHKALHELRKREEGTISEEGRKCYEDRRVRMEFFKKEATLACRSREYEKALCCYNKALEQINDSPLLYNNRGLVLIFLGMYDKAIADFDTALKLNEKCLRSYLMLAKANFLRGTMSGYKVAIKQAKERHPKQIGFIEEYVFALNKGNN